MPIWQTISGEGDSAGLALFLAYVAQMLSIQPDPRTAIAATGDMTGQQVRSVGGIYEKATAAHDAGACLTFIPAGQTLPISLLTSGTRLVGVKTLPAAARVWLTYRASTGDIRCTPAPKRPRSANNF